MKSLAGIGANRVLRSIVAVTIALWSLNVSAQTTIARAPLQGWSSCNPPQGPYRSPQEKCNARAALLKESGMYWLPELVYEQTSPTGGRCRWPGRNDFWDYPEDILYCPDGFFQQNTSWQGCAIPPSSIAFRGSQAYCARLSGEVEIGKNLGQCADGTCGSGNPISPFVGNKYQGETDYASGASPLRLQRAYNSRVLLSDESHFEVTADNLWHFGRNWRGNYDLSVQLTQTATISTAAVRRPDGKLYGFTLTSGSWVADSDVSDRLVRLLDGSGNPIGWQYTSAAREDVETYDVDGKLTSSRDRAGVTQTIMYSDGSTSPSIAPRPGLLIQVTDSFGKQLNFTYDAVNRIVSMTDPAGGTYAYAYDANNNLTSVTYPGSVVRTYVYNESANTAGTKLRHALTGIVDEASNRYATYKYDTSGRAVSTEHAGTTGKVSITYPSGTTSLMRTVTDSLGVARTYNYQKVVGVAKNTAVSQQCFGTGCGTISKAVSFDTNGNVASRTDFKDGKTCHAYDLTRNLETVRVEGFAPGISCPANLASYTPTGGTRQRKISTQWHSTYRLPTLITEAGRTTAFTHEASGNVLTKTVTDVATSTSRTWTYTYNSFGKVLTTDGPRTDVSDVTTYTYYSCATGYQCGQVQTITNAAGHVTTFNTYNAHGQPLTITDPNDLLTTLTYDARQRLTSRALGSEQTTFTYWPTGLLRKTTLPDSSFIEYSYDAAHRLTGVTDSEGNSITYTLDAAGNRTAEEIFDPSSVLTQKRTRVFNTLNQLWKELGAAGTTNVTTTFGYDNNGNQTTINAPLSRNTVQGYDELNRPTQVTDPLSGVTQYGYNALDQLISVTDPRSKVTSYTNNALDDLTQQVSPDTGTTVNTYDAGGNLQTSTDARSKTGTYTYDALNRPASLTYPDQTLTYTYDTGTNQKGRLTQVTDNSGSTSWTYDTHGRVLSRQQTMGAISKTVGYAYDASGRLQTLTLPSGNTVTYGYSNGKVSSLTLNGSTTILSNVLYQPFGPTRGWTWGNSTLTVREYDLDGKITDIDSAGLKTYGYDDAFRITGIADASDSSLSQAYGYDLLDRLTSATGTSLNQGWTYDANGNRLTQTGSQPSTFTISGTSNRLSSVSGSLTRTYAYDNAGNTTGDGTATFTYNDAVRVVSSTKASVTTTHALNALGQRVKKTTSSNSTYFVYDEAGQLVGEYDTAGSLIQETLWFDDIPVAVLKPTGGGGVNVFHIHTDSLHTPRRISRPSDSVTVWRWDSDPFGVNAASEDPDGDSNPFVYGLRFPGQYFDSETALNQNYFRDYDSRLGRYIQSDPIGLRGGLNTYVYGINNPVTYSDPTGQFSGAGVALWRAYLAYRTYRGIAAVVAASAAAASSLPADPVSGEIDSPRTGGGDGCPPGGDLCPPAFEQLMKARVAIVVQEVLANAAGIPTGHRGILIGPKRGWNAAADAYNKVCPHLPIDEMFYFNVSIFGL